MRNGTVCFINQNNKLLLALIDYGKGNSKWTGIGGYVEDGETLEEAVVREGLEETAIQFDKDNLTKVAELKGTDDTIHVFFSDTYSGELTIKEDSIKKLQWFDYATLPYTNMHPGTPSWMPLVLAGRKVVSENGTITVVSSF